MAGIDLDISRLRGYGRVKELVAYLGELRAAAKDPDTAICHALLEAVEQDLITTDTFSVFIPWSKSPAVIARCLNYEPNADVRAIAIKELARHLKRPRKCNWELTWEALGGTEGLVQIFSRSSVAEVKTLSVLIGCCNRGERTFARREQCIEELLRALLPGVYKSPPEIQSKDKRPVQRHYAKMLPACSASFVNKVLDSRDSSNPLYRRRNLAKLAHSHRDLLRERAIKHLFGGGPKDEDVSLYVDTFLYGDKDFAIKTLQGRLEGTVTEQRWGSIDEISVLMPIVNRLAKNAGPTEVRRQIHDLIKVGLELLGKSRKRRGYSDKTFWELTFRLWRMLPSEYEDVLRGCLRLGLAELPHKNPGSYIRDLGYLPPGPTERFLQLCYLDIPKQGLDLFSANDFSAFAKQTWHVNLIRLLKPEHAIHLLKKLYEANAEYNFLEPPPETSILAMRHVGSQDNFNVDLYLTLLQRDDQKVQQNAKDAIDRLRKKASAAREQADRAAFAKAAATYAIATGDLDVYGETVVWQQRFVRDPLTVKTIFARQIVRTDEGVELLSAIPKPETLAAVSKDNHALLLDELSRRIKSADAVVRTLQESYLLAKREPSFHESDWAHVKELFNAVVTSRVSRSKTVQKHFNIPEGEVSRVVWGGFLAAFEWLDADFINQIKGPVEALLQGSRPGFLATATKSLVDIGSERRKRREAQNAPQQITTKLTSNDKPSMPGWPGFPGTPPPGFPREPPPARTSASESDSLELMAYGALSTLARSSTPGLALPLILQTILDRPDASSWHRGILSPGLLKNLRAAEAHELLMGLAKGIGEKLEEQSYVRVGESEAPKHVPSQPAVKVTTVKYLAQLLNNAEFISNDAAVEVLIELFKAAQHRDIRLAALESLLSLLDSACTGTQEEMEANPTIRKIMAALETVIPVAGSINERRPLQPEEWAEAEETGVLPELSDVTSSTLPPLMAAVVCAAFGNDRIVIKKLETQYVRRLVLPVLEQLQKEHTRWVDLFLAKHQATALKNEVPETPMEPHLWTIVLTNYYASIPTKYLYDLNRYAIHCIAPTPALKQFSTSLRANAELRKSPEVQHWLHIFDRGVNQFRAPDTNTLFQLLDDQQKKEGECGTFLTIIAQHASLYLDNYEKHISVWDRFVNSLAPTAQIMEKETAYRRWHESRRVISLQVIDMIRHKKQQRQRLMLPSTTKMELWLLLTPGWSKGNDKCRDFVSRLEDCLLGMLKEDDGCVLRWPEIARVACEVIAAVVTKNNERLRVAECMSNIGRAGQASDVTSRQLRLASDLIKLEVVLRLIDQCGKKESDDLVARCVKVWRGCDSDAIRERVFKWETERSSTPIPDTGELQRSIFTFT
ncbi:hypothetical protein Daus18300_002496 [Diaporthe australafricana]|uniref:Uncharacterized protein n=1 Tax=Diaporthe australafricana TaxID=127596 RepID=A0ABR3XNE6_9PEZI